MSYKKNSSVLLLSFVSSLLFTTMTHAQLLDFTNSRTVNEMWVVNDGVMGGVSQSRLSFETEGAVFDGVVSLDNGGGFASVRSSIVIPVGTLALSITIRGDEKRYKLVLRTDTSPRSPLYQAEFFATREWKTHRFVSGDFKASFRGRPVEAPALDFSATKEIGVLIANQQSGSFRLQLKNVQSAVDAPR
jgi:NADH dehydrogenase [ubiquinone] 1 alpha subcomplex assembly factor 1